MSSLDDRWRKREKERRALAKLKAATASTVKFPTVTLPSTALERQDALLERVLHVLNGIRLTIKDLHIRTDLTWYGNAQIRVAATVKPILSSGVRVTDGDGNILLFGDIGDATSPESAVRMSRQFLINLVTHEIDEWLFEAGLGPNPHTWPDGHVPATEVGKLSPEKFSDTQSTK